MPALILVSGGLYTEEDSKTYRLRTFYGDAMCASGGLPALYAGGDAESLADAYGGLLLSGGFDIDPEFYGQKAQTNSITYEPERDKWELALMRAFCARKKPVFGICRGIQLINVFFSGTLWQDILTQTGVAHDKPFHFVNTPGGTVRELFGERFMANSFHHQAVRAPGDGLEVTARGDDGIVEAVEHRALPVMGVQWHPERMINQPGYLNMQPLFTRFVGLCGGA